VPLHNEEVASIAELVSKSDTNDAETIEAALMLKTEMEDRGMAWESFFGGMAEEVRRWSTAGHEQPVPIDSIFKYMPSKLSQDVDIMLMGEASQRGFVGRYGDIVLRVNKTERSEALENEILAHIGCPHVKEKVRFMWGVDPADTGLPIFDKGVICPYSPESGCSCGIDKAVWTTEYVNDLPDSCFAYVEAGADKDKSKRHLPYKDKGGKPDAAHVRNALARLNQTNISAAAKASARRKLVAAAKQLGVKVAEKVGKSRFTDTVVTHVSIDWSNRNRVEKTQRILSLWALDRHWMIEGNTATSTEPITGE
jgi:hypothetical protein